MECQQNSWIAEYKEHIASRAKDMDIPTDTKTNSPNSKIKKITPTGGSLNCVECGKLFCSQSSLTRHIKEVHKIEAILYEYHGDLYNFKCLEPDCNTSFKGHVGLRMHLQTVHKIDCMKVEMYFQTFEDFTTWLTKEEYENDVQYTKKSGQKAITTGIEKIYLHCNRSGKPSKELVPPEKRQRAPRRQGSCKINNTCTSQIIIDRNPATGICSVVYYKRHYGHDNDKEFIRKKKYLNEDKKPAKLSPVEFLKNEICLMAKHIMEDIQVSNYSLDELEVMLYNLRTAAEVGIKKKKLEEDSKSNGNDQNKKLNEEKRERTEVIRFNIINDNSQDSPDSASKSLNPSKIAAEGGDDKLDRREDSADEDNQDRFSDGNEEYEGTEIIHFNIVEDEDVEDEEMEGTPILSSNPLNDHEYI